MGAWGGRCGLGSGVVVLVAGGGSKRAREGGLVRESSADGIVDGIVNHASLQEVLEFLYSVS